jgi:hypothetical protein
MELVRQAIRYKILGSHFDYLTPITHVVSKNFLSNCLRHIIIFNIFKVLQSSCYTIEAFYIFYTIYIYIYIYIYTHTHTHTHKVVKVEVSNLK